MAKKNSGLGRGLDAIFLDNATTESADRENRITVVKLSMIDPNKDQPRKSFDKDSLEELAASISENGLLQPILVREYHDGRYQIIAGERRFRASKLAGLTEVPTIILDKDDRKVAEISLIENIQREDLNPIEEALGYKALSETYGMTQEEISQKTGKNRSTVANMMRLLNLPREVLQLLAERRLSAGHARTLLALKNPDDVLPTAMATIDGDLSVRSLEELVKKTNKKKPEKSDKEEEKSEPIVDYFRELELRVQSALGRRCIIEEKGRKKSITLYYEDNYDLTELLESILGKDFLDN